MTTLRLEYILLQVKYNLEVKPVFPNFSKLSLSHKRLIENHTNSYPPFSDFTFASLWTYDTQGTVELSILNNNLVVKFQDYISNEPFYSFIGSVKPIETTQILLDHSTKMKYKPQLKLIPETVILSDPKIERYFQITEDPDNHDYIVSAKDLASLPKKIYEKKRYSINRFARKYPHHKTQKLELSDQNIQNQIINLFFKWEENSKKKRRETETELIAIKKMLSAVKKLKIHGTGIFIDEKLVAFTIYEVVQNKYGMAMFEKADRKFADIYARIAHLGAIHLQEMGVEHINFEQDLGIQGLRIAKSLWKPTHFLKKYIIKPKK